MQQNSKGKIYELLPADYHLFPQEEKESREIHLRDYGKVLRKRCWTILAFFVIVVVTTAIVTFTMRPVYRSSTTIQINKENPHIVDFKEVFAVNTMDLDYYQTQYKILESRSLARRVIQVLDLAEHPEFTDKPGSSPLQTWRSEVTSYLSSLFAFVSLSPGEPSGMRKEAGKESQIVDRFLKKVKIEPVRNSRLVKVHFDSHAPDLSTEVVNTLAAAYIQQSLEARFTATEQARKWLNQQLDDLKGKVERADESLQSFGSKHDIISLEEKENITMQRLTELNEALAKAEEERMAREAIYKHARDNFESLPSILGNKLIQNLKESFIQLEAQYMKQAQTFKADHPEMKRLRNQMEAIQNRLSAEIGKIIAGIGNEYESALHKESLLRGAFNEQKARALEMKQKAIRYNILKREADTNKDLYKGLLLRMKEAGVSAGITASNIQVVDRAELPTKPFRPNKELNLLLASVIGLFLGVGLAFFFEYLDNTVKTPDDVEGLTRLPSFGTVPEISFESRKQLPAGSSYPVELITHRHPKSMLSEAYRNIRTSILLSFSGKPPKTLVVSSPNPSEGKTTTAVNTAIALSQTGARVLLIDADMRKPRIHQIFTGENGKGLSNFLSGNAPLDEIIKSSEIPNFAYILSGPIPPNPSELLGSNIFKDMLQTLGERFDHVVIDSPPILGFADSVILSAVVDGVMVVVVSGKTPRETLQQAKETLQQVNARILGVVINRIDLRRNGYGAYYHRYHYYYGEKANKKKKELPASTEN